MVARRARLANTILALDEAAGILARRDMPKRHVVRQGAEERNPGANEHGNARDDQAVDEPGRKEALDRDPAIHVHVLEAAGGKLGDDVGRSPRQVLHHRALRCGGKGTRAEQRRMLSLQILTFIARPVMAACRPRSERVTR